MPSQKLIAVITALTCLAGAQRRLCRRLRRTARRRSRTSSSPGTARGLRAYLVEYPALLEGDDPARRGTPRLRERHRLGPDLLPLLPVRPCGRRTGRRPRGRRAPARTDLLTRAPPRQHAVPSPPRLRDRAALPGRDLRGGGARTPRRRAPRPASRCTPSPPPCSPAAPSRPRSPRRSTTSGSRSATARRRIAADRVIIHNPSFLKFDTAFPARIVARGPDRRPHENLLRPGGHETPRRRPLPRPDRRVPRLALGKSLAPDLAPQPRHGRGLARRAPARCALAGPARTTGSTSATFPSRRRHRRAARPPRPPLPPGVREVPRSGRPRPLLPAPRGGERDPRRATSLPTPRAHGPTGRPSPSTGSTSPTTLPASTSWSTSPRRPSAKASAACSPKASRRARS